MKQDSVSEPIVAPAASARQESLPQNEMLQVEGEASFFLQTKLNVGDPDDPFEKEADVVADKVMRSSDANFVQLKCAACEEEETIHKKPLSTNITPFVQTKSNGESTDSNQLTSSIENSRGNGSSMDNQTKSFMEDRIGADFGSVKIHSGQESVQMNRALNAQAFTTGNDIYFNEGKYSPETDEGKRLLAHELTHVLQQNAPVADKAVQKKQNPAIGPITEPSQTADSEPKKDKTDKKDVSGTANNQGIQSLPPEEPSKGGLITNKAPASTSKTAEKPATSPIGKDSPKTAGAKGVAVESLAKGKPTITATDNPGDMLVVLQSTPATQLPETLNQAKGISSQSMQMQKDKALELVPTVAESTGSAYGENNKAKVKHIAPKASATVKNKFEGKGDWQPPVVEEVAIPPQAKFVPSGLLSRFGNSEGSENITGAAQNELGNINLDTSNLPDELGAAPELTLTGEASINNLSEEQEEQTADLLIAKNNAQKEIQNDFGENDVIQKPGKEKIKSKHRFKKTQGINSTAVSGGSNLSPEIAAKLDASLAGQASLKIGEQSQKYQQDEAAYQQKLIVEKQKTDEQISDETIKSKTSQNKAQQNAQKQVAESRVDWQKQLDATETDFKTKATNSAVEHIGKIGKETEKGNAEAKKHYDDANKQAAEKTAAAKQEAEDKKKKSEEDSGGFFGWLADAASALIDGLKKAVNFIFDKLRAALKWVFEQAKKFAMAALELARKAVVGLIKGFGIILKGFVDIAFAAFPTIRDAINAKIDSAVDTAVTATNKAFERFKQIVADIIDAFAEFVDTALAFVQKALTIALSVIEVIVVGFLKVMAFLNDIERQYKLFKAMIDGFLLIWDHPEILEEKAKEFLEPYIKDIPGSTESEVKKALALFGLATAKHITGIMKYLTPNINHLIANWWGEAKKMIWFLIWPFAEGSPLYEDAPKLWRLIPQMWNDLWDGEFSKVIDGGLEWMQALNMTVGAFAGWIVIGGTVVGAILGGIFGVGAGAIPGAGAGFEVGIAIGEGIMASMIVTETAVIAKSVYDLSVTEDDGVESTPPPAPVKEKTAGEVHADAAKAENGPRQYTSGQVKTGRDRILYAYQRIANSGLTLGVMVALLLLGAIGGKIAQGLLAGIKKLGTVIGKLLPEVAEGFKSAAGALKDSKIGQGFTKAAEGFNEGRAGMKEKIGGLKEKVGLGGEEKPGAPKEKTAENTKTNTEPTSSEVDTPIKPEAETKVPETKVEPEQTVKTEPEPVAEPEPKVKSEPEPTAEPEAKTPDQQKGEDFAKKAQNDEGVVSKGKAKDGHELKVDSEGHIVKCSDCKVYEISHREILKDNPQLAEELKELRKRMAEAPEDPAVMKDLEAFDEKITNLENKESIKPAEPTAKEQSVEEPKAKEEPKGTEEKAEVENDPIEKKDGVEPDSAEADTTKIDPNEVPTDEPLPGQAGSKEHMAERWAEYEKRMEGNPKKWKKERWENVYRKNMTRAKLANKAVDAYKAKLEWGGKAEREVRVEIEGVERRFDIMETEGIPPELRKDGIIHLEDMEKAGIKPKVIEHKTGKIYNTKDIQWEIARDEILMKEKGWQMEWVFEGEASGPLKKALEKAGIPYKIIPVP
ncbi:DUF4157 domain-containing protein [Pedobacter sp. V48]|uniref:eCIS core domain-containing protein n=1 Tax=Pedobacter sp. V48 TaxID=509635 RepID=UPI0003E4FC79|nr:DUF4157 domain-containing protein [Pedobacter sp. V48]ETZ22009.1 hypothetical protein N824_24105 [Pedobacter sp. V48]